MLHEEAEAQELYSSHKDELQKESSDGFESDNETNNFGEQSPIKRPSSGEKPFEETPGDFLDYTDPKRPEGKEHSLSSPQNLTSHTASRETLRVLAPKEACTHEAVIQSLQT